MLVYSSVKYSLAVKISELLVQLKFTVFCKRRKSQENICDVPFFYSLERGILNIVLL